MTPHTTGGTRGGNLVVDRELARLGKTRKERRLRFSIHSKDEKKLRRANAIIDKLVEAEQWSVLRALRDGEITVSDLIEADRDGQVSLTLVRVKLRAFLWDRITVDEDGTEHTEVGVISRTLATVRGERNRGRYLTSMKALQAKGEAYLPVNATVADLARVPWDELYEEWGASNTDWMHLRRAVSRSLTLYFGDKWHPFARKVRYRLPSKKVKKRRPNLPIDRFLAIVGKAPAHAAAAFWVLAITGMRVGEYLACTREHIHRETHTLTVPGADKNTVGAMPVEIDPRWWGYIEQGVPSRLRYKWLNIHWNRACRAAGVSGITMHDLRHCHGQWAIDAGIAESKVQASLRHENADQTRDYVLRASSREVSTALADRVLAVADTTRKPKRARKHA